MCSARAHVRFTPESRHVQCTHACPLWAISGLMRRSKHQGGPCPWSVSCTCLSSALLTNSTESIAAPSWMRNWSIASFGLGLGFAPLAREHEQPQRTHGQLHGKIQKQDAARHTVDDQAENSPDGKRVGEEHRPDHRHMPPLRRERSDDAEGRHAEIEAHKSSEDVGLIDAFHRDVHELREARCRIDAIAQRDWNEEHSYDQ